MIARTHQRRRSGIRAAVAAGALSALSLIAPLRGDAAGTRIPATFYPAGATISYFPHVSNHSLDCQWGFFCEGPVPLFHFQTQTQLHRLGGWAQYAVWGKGAHRMQFAVYASQYESGVDANGHSWAWVALQDLVSATRAHRYVPLPHTPRLLPIGATGRSIAELQPGAGYDLVVMGCEMGNAEVEAIVVFDQHSRTARTMALDDLTQQVRRAILLDAEASAA